MTYDPAISEVVLFGGVYNNGATQRDDTLTFNLSTGWSQQSPSNSPPPMKFGSIDYIIGRS